jgi:hypothetical protein
LLGWERLRTTEICTIDLSRSQPSFYRIAFFKRLTEGRIEWDRLNICTIVGSRYKPILLVLLYTICLIWVAFIGLDCKGWERLQMVPTTGNEHTPLLPRSAAPPAPCSPVPCSPRSHLRILNASLLTMLVALVCSHPPACPAPLFPAPAADTCTHAVVPLPFPKLDSRRTSSGSEVMDSAVIDERL